MTYFKYHAEEVALMKQREIIRGHLRAIRVALWSTECIGLGLSESHSRAIDKASLDIYATIMGLEVELNIPFIPDMFTDNLPCWKYERQYWNYSRVND